MELRKVIVIGNACGVTIPKAFLRTLNVAASDHVQLFLNDKNTLVIRKYNGSGRRINDGRE